MRVNVAKGLTASWVETKTQDTISEMSEALGCAMRAARCYFYSTFTVTGRDAMPLHTTRKSLTPLTTLPGTSKLVDAGLV